MKIFLLVWLGGSFFIVLLILLQALADGLDRVIAARTLRRAKRTET